jgi:hypothetical protein
MLGVTPSAEKDVSPDGPAARDSVPVRPSPRIYRRAQQVVRYGTRSQRWSAEARRLQ